MSRITSALSGLVLAAVAAGLVASVAEGAGAQSVQIVNSGSGCSSAFCFVPATLSASSGDTVAWTNQSAAPHTVTRCDPSACSGQGPGTGADSIGSGTINMTGTYVHTFSGAGSYLYYCAIHGFATMHGSVTVAGPTPPPTPPPAPVPTPTPKPSAMATVPPARSSAAAAASPSPSPSPSATASPTSSPAVAFATPPDTAASPSASAVNPVGSAIGRGGGFPLVPAVIVVILLAGGGAGVAAWRLRKQR